MISSKLSRQLKQDYDNLLQILNEKDYTLPHISKPLTGTNSEGKAYAIANPIQGLLKYHGMVDFSEKLAYIPSISLNNDSVFTVTYLEMNKDFQKDVMIINGEKLNEKSSKFQRILHQLNKMRNISQIKTNCTVVSRNFSKDTHKLPIGKGLGTSASGGAAIATAFMDIIYRDQPQLRVNSSIKSYFSRFLAGSASRSAVGGLGLWLNHPAIESERSLSLRLDRKQDKSFIDQITLITVPIPAKVTTNEIHQIAPNSFFFSNWLQKRYDMILKFLNGLWTHDFHVIGKLAEFDTLALHSVSMTADLDNINILWAPETIKIMNFVIKLRNQGIPAYFSIDTGPSVVILTQQQYQDKIILALNELALSYPISIGHIGESSKKIDVHTPEAKLLSGDMQNFHVI